LQGKQTLITGVVGPQGSGKTLLSKIVGASLQALCKNVVFMSSDDFYLPYDRRLALQQEKPF
jgi:pantothenate kinase-related protein Tda10